jgi:hypothetical protein
VNDDVEVTIVLRMRRWFFPDEDELRDQIEELFDCDVLSIDEEEV